MGVANKRNFIFFYNHFDVVALTEIQRSSFAVGIDELTSVSLEAPSASIIILT